MICLPCDAGMMHPFPPTTYPNYTNEPKQNTSDVTFFNPNARANDNIFEEDVIPDETDNQTIPPPGFDHAIDSEDNTKNAEK